MNVKVVNDNVYEFKQNWNDMNIIIPPKGYIVMEKGKAHDFVCAWSPMRKNGTDQPDPKSFKMLHIEPLGDSKKEEVKREAAAEAKEYRCQKCGFKAPSVSALDDHMTTHLNKS